MANNVTFFEQPPGEVLVVPLPPLSTQLVFTLISAFTELGFASALILLVNLNQCRSLSRNRPVSIPQYSIRHRAVHILAMVVFIILELIFSLYSREHTHLIKREQRCTLVHLRTSEASVDGTKHDGELESVFFSCLKVDGSEDGEIIMEAHAGNSSRELESLHVDCTSDWQLKFKLDDYEDVLNPEDAEHHCHAEVDICAFAYTRGQKVFCSEAVPKSILNTTAARVYGTTLRSKLEVSPKSVAKHLVQMYHVGLSDEIYLRKSLFLDQMDGSCSITVKTAKQTLVPIWLVLLAVLMWLNSTFLFVLTRFLKPKVFFNISDPLHWARRTYWCLNTGAGCKFSYLRSCVEDGVRRVYLSDCKHTGAEKCSEEEEEP